MRNSLESFKFFTRPLRGALRKGGDIVVRIKGSVGRRGSVRR